MWVLGAARTFGPVIEETMRIAQGIREAWDDNAGSEPTGGDSSAE